MAELIKNSYRLTLLPLINTCSSVAFSVRGSPNQAEIRIVYSCAVAFYIEGQLYMYFIRLWENKPVSICTDEEERANAFE